MISRYTPLRGGRVQAVGVTITLPAKDPPALPEDRAAAERERHRLVVVEAELPEMVYRLILSSCS